MDIKRKKELLAAYHDRRPEMGVISSVAAQRTKRF